MTWNLKCSAIILLNCLTNFTSSIEKINIYIY